MSRLSQGTLVATVGGVVHICEFRAGTDQLDLGSAQPRIYRSGGDPRVINFREAAFATAQTAVVRRQAVELHHPGTCDLWNRAINLLDTIHAGDNLGIYEEFEIHKPPTRMITRVGCWPFSTARLWLACPRPDRFAITVAQQALRETLDVWQKPSTPNLTGDRYMLRVARPIVEGLLPVVACHHPDLVEEWQGVIDAEDIAEWGGDVW